MKVEKLIKGQELYRKIKELDKLIDALRRKNGLHFTINDFSMAPTIIIDIDERTAKKISVVINEVKLQYQEQLDKL